MRRADLDPDPHRQFEAWLAEARPSEQSPPDTMTLATATRDGRPSARQVLLKSHDERGFTFFTGYGSRKARELAENPRAALLLHFASLGRQVRIEGAVEKVAREEASAYWQTRPRGSRIGALASRQSEVLASRSELEARVAELERAGGEPELPDHWGGFRLVPDTFEFWEHRDDRLHDRFRYRRDGTSWAIDRLSP